MANEALTQGTKEYLLVDITDRLGNLTDLTGTSPTFKVIDDVNAVKIAAGTAANFLGMTVYCLIDTTAGGAWVGAGLTKTFRLYITLTVGAEVPVLGPFPFDVIAT